jgi:hypothetical protein
MKKISLSVFAIFIILFFQNCKKSTTDNSTTTLPQLTAIINGITWTPDTLSASITYNAAAKTKTLSFTGTHSQKQIACTVTLNNATATNDFTTGANTVDATSNPLMVYSTQQKDGNGNYVFVPAATAGTGNGTVAISAVNSTGGLISGTFDFSYKKANYDSDGNTISVTNDVITGGTFTNMPYTFITR